MLETQPGARIGVIYQNDDFGRDHLNGLRLGLGDKAPGAISKAVSFEVTDATVDLQIVDLKELDVNVVLIAAIPKFAAQAICKMHDIGWNPLKLLVYPAASIPATLKPAGLDASIGVVTADFVKQPGDQAWDTDPEMVAFLGFMRQYSPSADPTDKFSVAGYYNAAMVVALLKSCGDNLTRQNILT